MQVISSSEAYIIIRKEDVYKIYKQKNYLKEKRVYGTGGKGEAYFLKKYPSPYFVKLIKEIPDGLILEKLGKKIGDVKKETVIYKDRINSEELVKWLKGLQKELDRLEIAHGDIAPVNILKKGNTFKLIDFPVAREKGEDGYEEKRQKDIVQINKLIKIINDT